MGILPRSMKTARIAFPRLISPGQQQLEMLKPRAFLREDILEECLETAFCNCGERSGDFVWGLRLLEVGCISPNFRCPQGTYFV